MSKIVIIALILAILVICSPYILRFFDMIYIYIFKLGWLRGEKTKEKLVEKYIEGLRTGNIRIIERLVPKTHEATKEIREKIEIFKEADFSVAKINFDQNPSLLEHQIEIKNIRLKSGEVVSDKIWIEMDCGQYHPSIIECKKWYLLIGVVKEKFQPIPSLPVIELKR